MTKTRSTKAALLSSVLALFLCITMLLGTTFAWFTDSVTSANNIIKSGNLDIELEYWDGDSWEDVAGKSDILTNTLYEPGVTEVAYLRVANAGTLALKYQLGINIVSETEGTNMAGDPFKLSDYIMFGVVEGINGEIGAYADRDAAVAAVSGAQKISAGYTKADSILADAAPVYLALVVYMPTSVGNEANYKKGTTPPQINLGINVIATQVMNESDSFGTDYDENSKLPEIGSVVKPAGEAATVSTEEVAIIVPETAHAGDYAIAVSNKNVSEGTLSLNIDLIKDGQKVVATAGVLYTVQIEVGENLEVTGVTHNGVAIDSFNYDPATGIVTFTTDSFSPFTVTYKAADENSVFVPSDSEAAEKLEKEDVVAVDENGNEYTTLKEAVESGASKLYLKEDADLGTITHIDVANDLVIYGNGAYISGGERDFAIDTYVKLEKDITVTVYNLHGIAFWAQRNTEYTVTMNLYNCNNLSRIYINGTSGNNIINVVNCTAVKGSAVDYENVVGDTVIYSNANGSITVDGCTFTNVGCPINLNHKVAGEQTVTVTNTTFVDCATAGTAAYYAPIRLYNSAEGANQTLTVAGNTFTYSEGKAPVNKADVLLNAKHNGVDATGTINATVQANAAVTCGANVDVKYSIANANELLALSDKKLKGTYELIASIDMGGAEFKAMSAWYANVIFNGNGHTISNVNVVSGDNDNGTEQASMFYVSTNGSLTVSKLTLKDITVTTKNIDNGYAAAVIGYCEGTAVLENVDVVNTNVTGSKSSGTLVGHLTPAGKLTATDCDVSGNITISDFEAEGHYAGEYVGTIAGDTALTKCTANVTIGGNLKSSNIGTIFGRKVSGELTIDGNVYISNGLCKDINSYTYFVSNAEGLATLNTMMAKKTAGRDVVVNLTAHIDFAGKTWTPVDSHADSAFTLKEINGNGYVLSNLTVNGQAMFTRFAGTGDVVIKDITFDSATINSNGKINTSILTVQTYQNVLLDNVDVKNSTISGGYKVAPLIATVYNEGSSTITATLKNCDVEKVEVKATSYDFCTTGMVAFVKADDNDKIEFENCTVTDVKLIAPDDSYDAHAAIYTTGSETLINEAEGVTVTNVTFEALN